MGHKLVTPAALSGLTRLSRTIDEVANLPHRINQPFVGMSAFAHKVLPHVGSARMSSACARGPLRSSARGRMCRGTHGRAPCLSCMR